MATKKTNTSSMTISEKAKMVKGILQNAEHTAYNNAVVSLPKALFPEAETEGEDAVRRRQFEIAAQSGIPLSTRTIERNIKRPYTVAAQSDLPYDEYSALHNFNQAGAVKALENMGIDSEIAQPSAARTQQYINDALKAYDEWKKSRPASYAQASQSDTYSDSELRDLAGKDAKTNILAQETWDRENRNSGENDTWDNVLTNMGAVSDDYLKYIQDTVIPQNISTIEQNNAALDRRIANATTADLYGSEIAGDRNRLMIDTVIDIYQGKGKTADNAEALRSVFGKDMTDAEVNAVINDIKADPDAFLEKNLIDMQQYHDQWERDERIPAYEQLSEDISSELANREAYNTLMSDAQSSPTYEQDKVFTPVDNGRATGTSADMSTLYMWLNDSDFRKKYDNANYMSMTQALDNPFWAKGYEYMTEEEIYGFNAAYAQSDEAAERYLSSLNATGVLNRRRAEAQVYFSTNFTENSPFVAKGLTFGTNVITAVQSPVQLVAAATGYETDPNSSMYDINRFNTTVRGTFNQMANEVSPVLGFVDNVLTSVADNMIAVGISKGFAGAAGLTGDAAKKWVTGMTQSIMSSNAASNSLYESLQTGDDQVTAVAKAIASGGIEALTEKYSIETLLGDTTGAWKYLAKNFLAEGSEEVASDLLNPIADKFISGITNNRTEIEREYNNYILQGYSKKEASDMVMNGFVKDLVYDFFVGGFAGGLGAGTFIATNAYQGSQIKKSGSTSKLVEIAEKMPEGSQSRKYADAVKRTGSNYATAQLYSTLMQDLDSASQDTVTSIAAGELARDLRNVGETGDSETVARNILKVYQGETLTEEERNTILNSKHGAELMDKASLVSSRDSTELKAYNEAYAAGFYGRESTQNMNQTYYQAGVKAAQVAEQKRLAAAGTGKAGTGSVSYIGTVVSDADISKKNAMKIGANTFTHLEEQQQIAASAIQDIAKATSLNFVLYEGQADDSGAITVENGKYEPMTNTLYIDLNSGKNRSGQGVIDYTIMQTVAHETTHFIARNSKSGYATLQSLVRKTLEERGQDFDELVRQKVRIAENSGVELTREGAVEEVMANASEMMLKDTKVFQQLAKQNKSLVEKVKTFVSDLLSKIRKALGKVGAQHPEAKALMEAEQYVAGLQETWDAALVEALETVKGSETEASASAEEAKFSFKDMTGQDMPVGSEAYDELKRTGIVSRSISNQFSEIGLVDRYTRESRKSYYAYADEYASRRAGSGSEGTLGTGEQRNNRGRNAGKSGVKFSLRDQTETKQFKRWFKDSEVVDSDGNPKIVYHATDAAFTVFDRNKLGSNTRTNTDSEAAARSAEVGFWFSDHDLSGDMYADNSMPVYLAMENGYRTSLDNMIDALEDVTAEDYVSDLQSEGYDGLIVQDSEFGGTSYVVFEPEQIKSATDNVGTFDPSNPDIRYSLREETEALASTNVQLSEDGDSAYPTAFSLRTWNESDYKQNVSEAAKALSKELGVSERKAKKWINDVNSIAKYVADHKELLDYEANEFASAIKTNTEYGSTLDFSTLCPKRLITTGTFDAIQRAMPDTVLTQKDIFRIRNMLVERNIEVACGSCYVESTRKKMGEYANRFLTQYKETNPDWVPNMVDLNTVDGLDAMHREHPEAYDAYTKFMSRLAQRKPKMFEKRTEYRGEILKNFSSPQTVAKKNLEGGFRVQSYSDFEIVHMLDMMQAVMDMSRVGLASQGYTKVPAFAWIFGDTGVKINLSMFAKGVDENGKLVYDEVNGMKLSEAKALRDRYSKNVGTVLVVFSDEQLKAAMADDFVDYIIPFHRSQWSKRDYASLGLSPETRDYTMQQSEKWVTPHYNANGKKQTKPGYNISPNSYWDFSKSGKQNAETYLRMCAEEGKKPKFAKYLVNNGDGSYSLQPDGSTDGYWKLLIDFKMYDNNGKGSPQLPVKPTFNMEQANRLIREYKGGHNSFPVAQEVVDEFVAEKKSQTQAKFALRDQTESDLTRQYLESMEITDSMNESEKWLLGKYQRTQQEIAEKEAQIAEQDELKATAATPEDRTKAENRARILRDQVKRLRNAMRTMERSDGFGGLMRRSEEVVKRYMQYSDVTQATDLSDQLNADLNSLNSQLESAIKTIQSTEGAQRAMLAKGMLNEQSLTQAGKNVRATFGTRMSGKDISNRLALAYAELYATEGEQGAKNFARVMRDFAEDVLRRSNRRYQSATLDDLRESLQGSISLTDAQKQELKNAGISQSEFKRVMSGVVNVSDNGTSLASIVSNAEYYGSGIISQLASTGSEGDMILKLYNLVSEEKAKERSFALDGMSETDSINYTIAEIMSTSNIQLAVDQNTMDAIQTAMKQGSETNQKVVSKINAAMKNVRSAKVTSEQLWRSAANADQTARQALEYYRAIDEQRRILEEKEIVQQLKSDAVSKLREERTIREYAQKATSRMRHIRKNVKGLNDMLLHETDYKNVPEELKAYVGDVVTTFGEKFGSMVFSGKQAKELLATYEKLRNSDSSFMQAQYDEDLASTLHALNEWAEKYQQLKGSGKNRLEKAQLRILITEAVDDIVSNVKAMVKNSTETRINGRKKMFADIAYSAISEMMERPDHTTYQNKIGDATTWLERAIVTGNTTPVYFFDQLGNKQFKNLFKDFQNGQEKWAFISATSKQRIQEFRHAYNYDAWSDADALTFTTQQGHEITLDKEQALWLYATWKREHSNPIAATEHLTKGGFVYEGNKGTAVKKTRLGTKAAEITTGNRIAEADMKAVYGYLTEQEKGYADAMVNYLSTEIGALGNEISMELFGIRKYKEGYYFPYATARDQRFQKSASGGNATTDDSRIKHASFTHALTKGAATTLVMGNFTDVVANHIGQMALYSSMTLPIENMNRVLNYRFATEDGGTTTMRSLVRQKYGSNTLNYMERFLRDMNGGIRGTDKSAFQKTISLFKKSAVVASLSVSLQQTSAMLRAGAMMNYKYLLQTPANYKAEYDQLMQHSGVAIVKQMGRFDTNVGQSYNEWMLTPEDSNLKLWSKARQALFLDGKDAAKNRWEALVTGLPNTMDEVAWGMLWKAVKTEQADLHPNMDVNSEDFLNMCGERFNDIAYHTQVFDSTLTRSQLMRSTNPIDQMAAAFRAEPTLTLNVLYDAFFNKNIPKGERAKRRASALSAVMLSSIAAAFGSALISAWGKDDDDRTAAEKIVRTTNENFWNNLMPWYNIPYISDIVNLMQGYDVERADMSLFQDVVNGFNKVQQWRNGNTTWYRAMEEFVGSLANFLGIPAKNLMRDARRIYNMTNTRWEKPTQTGMEAALVPDSILPFLEYDTSAKTYCNRLTTAYLNGDKAKAADIETYMKTVLGKDADYIQDNVKKDVAERFKAGSITEEEGTDLLYSLYKDSDGFDKDSLFYYFDKLKDQMSGKLKKGETYSKYNDFYTAVETGKGLVPAINELTSHGTTKKAIASAITTHFKPTYVSLYKTDKKKAADLQSRLLTAYEQLGYDRSDKIKDIQKWVENDEKK